MTKLQKIKTIHTVIWMFFNVVIFYLYYAVIANKIDRWVWIGIGFIVGEGLVLLFNKWVCPLTNVAAKYTDSRKANFDIYLPEWIAKNNKTIYTSLFVLLLILLAGRIL